MSTAARVIIIEDEASIRQTLADTVRQVDGLEVVGTGGTVAEGRALIDAQPHVMLVDLALSDGSGFELIDHARRHSPDCKILVVSVFGYVRNVVRAIELGADGYLLKSADLAQAASAIHLVLGGGAPISPAVAGHILQRIRKPPPSRKTPPVLTARELEVLEALAKGLSFKEVAQMCELSHHTIPAAPATTFGPADVVLGAARNASPPVGSATSVSSTSVNPRSIAVRNGRLYAADVDACRVLVWNSVPTSQADDVLIPADDVIGHPSFTDTCTNTARPFGDESFDRIDAVAVDEAFLYASDGSHRRVLMIPHANE